jgi:hypothetical protein
VPASVPESPAAAFNAAIHWVPSAQVPLTQRGPTTIPQLETQRWPLNSSTAAGLFATSDLHCARAPALMAALGQLKAHGTQALPNQFFATTGVATTGGGRVPKGARIRVRLARSLAAKSTRR